MWMEVRYQRLQQLPNLVLSLTRVCCASERVDLLDRSLSQQSIARTQNLRVIRRQNILGREEHLLVKLFTRTNAAVLDLDIGADFESRQTNQIGRDIDNADLL